MNLLHRIWSFFVFVWLLVLAGCSRGWIDSPSTNLIDSSQEDVIDGVITQTVSLEQILPKPSYSEWGYRWDHYQITTHAFDANISGVQLDDSIANMTRYDIGYGFNQMQQSTNVTMSSIATCYLDIVNNQITWDTSTSGLMYHVRQWWSGWRPIVDGQTISLGDQKVLALTIKNPTPNLIQFSGSNACGPISPYWYARWYVARPDLYQLSLTYEYAGRAWSWSITNNQYSKDIDAQNPITRLLSDQAYPQGTRLSLPRTQWLIEFVSGSIVVSGQWVPLSLRWDMIMIDTSALQPQQSYEITLYDQWWGLYRSSLLVYNTLLLSPEIISTYAQEYWYYQWYRTQSNSIVIDVEKTNNLLSTIHSGVRLKQDVSFENCYGPSCVAFDLKLQSGDRIDEVIVVDQFGITWSVDLNFVMWAMKPSLQSAIVRWEGINLLTQWVWDNAIQVDYQNIATTTLSYYSCERRPQQDITQQLNQAWHQDGEITYARLEDILFVCQTSPINQLLTSTTELYRDPQVANLKVPSQLSRSKAFSVKTPYTKNNASQLFVQTQIGIYVKQSADEAYIWLFDLQSGAPITWSVQLQLYQLATESGWTTTGAQTITTRPYRIPTSSRGDMTALTVQKGDDRWFVTLWGRTNQTTMWTRDKSIDMQSAIKIGDVVDSSTIPTWWYSIDARIYGYTDRGLYKPGDKLFVAGWYRNITDIGATRPSTSWVTVSVIVRSTTDWDKIILQRTGMVLDWYGWFNTSFDIPKDIQVDDYVVQFVAGDDTSYTQTIKINEYQKPTFFINQEVDVDKDAIDLRIKPEYYFGAPVVGWTYRTDRSVASQSWWRWWWDMSDESEYYYDLSLQHSNSTYAWGTLAWWWSSKPVIATLLTWSMIPSKQSTLKIATTITDLNSNETHAVVDYYDLYPLVSIGLWGDPYDWYYAQTIKQLTSIPYLLSWSIKDTTTSYTWYYFDRRTQSMNQWVDGSMYYNGSYYVPVMSGSLKNTKGIIPTEVIDKPGDWLLVVQTFDSTGKEIGRNEKSIWYADWQWYNFGSMNNNYTLTVSIDQQQYDEGQAIPINITPYINWATVLITVEQWDRILDHYVRTLDGSQLSIPAKKSYYPSAVVSVTQIAWFDLINQSSTNKVRREPRMWQWYNQVKINQNLMKLAIDISTDKDTYQPWDKVTLTVKTTDYQGKPVDARLSVWVVDKSLNDLYSYFKSPLSDFFVSMGTTRINYTNMKWLYQWLKVFSQEWGKWWGWWWANPLWFLRQKFDDVAYRRGWVTTTNGIWTTTFTLPDNLTTWTIDVVGISMDSKVGTTTRDILATKDLIVQPNLPLYLTIGDTIQMPIKVLGITSWVMKFADTPVNVITTIKTIDDQIISQQTTKAQLNGSTVVWITIDPKWYQYRDIVILTQAQVWKYSDASSEVIPLRTNGLTTQVLKTVVDQQWTISYPMMTGSLNPIITMTLGQIPILSLENQLDYIIQYPYGCAEQILSIVSALLVTQSLAADGVLSSYISGDLVVSPYQENFSLSEAVQNARTRIRTYQWSDWWFSYCWDRSSEYMISVYVYGMMVQYPQLYLWYERKLTELGRYLDSNGWASNPDQYLYYLYHKSNAKWWVNMAQVKQLVNSDTTARVVPELLGAAIAVRMWDTQLAKQWFDRLNIDDFDGRQTEYWSLYPIVTPRSALAIYQSLIDQLSSQPKQLHQELLVALIRQRNDQWLWWYSTIDNLAALKMIAISQSHRDRQPVSCTITRADKQEQITLTWWQMWTKTFTDLPMQDHVVQWKCSNTVIIDSKFSAVMTQIPQSLLTKKNVEYLQWTLPHTIQPWQMGHAIAQFKINQPAPHTAIELYIPATYKLWDVINAKQTSSYDVPFTVEGSRWCRPDHYEVRFDRLFLYYNTLESNQSCRITIPILRAYHGESIMVPAKLWQMYDDSVYATQMPTILDHQ